MCGIFGRWQLDQKPLDLRKLQQATAAIRHRGPDDEGYLLLNSQSGRVVTCGGPDTNADLQLPPLDAFAGEAFDLAFGFRRLAILDLSPAGHQPMASPDGRYWIVYNGEVYNYLELRHELAALGYTFRSGSDTEVILAAYQEWGAACLNRFNGMWAFAIWDGQARSLFLARDRFGIKPLYYTQNEDEFSFGSELKTLVGEHGIPFQPSGKMIYRYVVAKVLPNPQSAETFFEGVHALPPGHLLHLQDQQLTVQSYWDLPYTERPPQSSDIAATVAEYRACFTDAVRLHLRADVPVGTCLSGGVDSSAIVCTIHQLLANDPNAPRQRTFSAVYATAGRHNERTHIEKVLAATQITGDFTEPTAERLQADLRAFVWHQDEPCLSTSPFAQWCVMQKAHEQGVTVLLDGQGADESLAGYRPYGVFLYEALRRGQWGQLPAQMQAIAGVTGLPAMRLFQQTALAALPDAPFMRLRNLWWRQQGLLDVLQPAFVQRWSATIADGYPYEHANSLGQHLDYKLAVSLPELLRYEDRNSMAHSIESRVPFLDHRLVEFAFTQAANLRIHAGWTKWILRQAMAGIVPDEILWRKDKVGFETPMQDWLATLLTQNPDLFAPGALSADYLNLDAVRQRIPELLQERQPNRSLLWRLMNLELWLQVWRNDQR